MEKKMKRNNPRVLLLLFTVISLLYFFPLVKFDETRLLLIHGDDLVFHFLRVFSMIDQIEYTGLPRAVGEFSLKKYAYGVNLFYPYLTSVMPITLFSMISNSVFKGYYFYLFVLNIITLLISYNSMKYLLSIRKLKLRNSYYRYAPFIFSILYTFSQYRSLNLLKRTALGEGVSMTFLPLVFAGFLSIILDKGKKEKWLIFGMAGLAYTHYITLLLVSIFLALGLLMSWKEWNPRMWERLLRCTFLAILLSAFSLFPLIEQSLHIEVSGAATYSLSHAAGFGSLDNIFSFSLKENINYFTLGAVHTIGFILCLCLLLKKDPNNPLRAYPLLIIMTIAVISFWTTTPLFPWEELQDTFIRTIQFPFRILSIVTLLTSFTITIAFLYLCSHFIKATFYQVLTVFLLMFGIHNYAYQNYINNIGDVYTSNTDLLAESHFGMANLDYLEKKTNAGYYINKIGNVNGIDRSFPYTMKGNKAIIDLSEIPEDSQVDFPLLAYKGAYVYTMDNIKIPYKIAKGALIRIQKKDVGKKVYVIYNSTILAKCAMLISLFILATLIFDHKKRTDKDTRSLLNSIKKRTVGVLNKELKVRITKKD